MAGVTCIRCRWDIAAEGHKPTCTVLAQAEQTMRQRRFAERLYEALEAQEART